VTTSAIRRTTTPVRNSVNAHCSSLLTRSVIAPICTNEPLAGRASASAQRIAEIEVLASSRPKRTFHRAALYSHIAGSQTHFARPWPGHAPNESRCTRRVSPLTLPKTSFAPKYRPPPAPELKSQTPPTSPAESHIANLTP
jgi:hypothetical protein